jgi:hypothetical protein
MHFLTSLIIVSGFAFVVCLSLVTIIVPTVNSIAMEHRRLVQFMATFFVAPGYHVQTGICTVSDLIERRFAEFAGAPYQNPLSRRQWEDLWETEAEL